MHPSDPAIWSSIFGVCIAIMWGASLMLTIPALRPQPLGQWLLAALALLIVTLAFASVIYGNWQTRQVNTQPDPFLMSAIVFGIGTTGALVLAAIVLLCRLAIWLLKLILMSAHHRWPDHTPRGA